LVLRKWRIEDQSQVASIFGDPEVMEFSDHGILTSEQQSDWLKKALAVRTSDFLSGPLAIVQKTSGEVVGYISLSNESKRNEQGDVEIGFRLIRRAWGKGYATEAVAGLLRRTKEISSITRIVAIVDPHNNRSIRVLEKLGMSRVGEVMLDCYAYPDALYAMRLRVS